MTLHGRTVRAGGRSVCGFMQMIDYSTFDYPCDRLHWIIQVIDTMVGMTEELSQAMGSTLGGSYNNMVVTMVQGIERAARFNDG